jgi:hypothetical protein
MNTEGGKAKQKAKSKRKERKEILCKAGLCTPAYYQ